MTQKEANELFKTELGQQCNEIFVTRDDMIFIRLKEAQDYCHDMLEEGDDVTKYNIKVFYNEYE